MSNKQISVDDVLYLADLAKMELTDEEREAFPKQLSSILQYIDKIKEVKISDEIQRDFRKINIFREDENPHQRGDHRDAILEEMPQVQDDLLVVKKILNN